MGSCTILTYIICCQISASWQLFKVKVRNHWVSNKYLKVNWPYWTIGCHRKMPQPLMDGFQNKTHFSCIICISVVHLKCSIFNIVYIFIPAEFRSFWHEMFLRDILSVWKQMCVPFSPHFTRSTILVLSTVLLSIFTFSLVTAGIKSKNFALTHVNYQWGLEPNIVFFPLIFINCIM